MLARERVGDPKFCYIAPIGKGSFHSINILTKGRIGFLVARYPLLGKLQPMSDLEGGIVDRPPSF